MVAKQQVARDREDTQHYGNTPNGEPDYVPAILELCQPAAPLAVAPPTAALSISHAQAA